MKKILIVTTNASESPDKKIKETGVWLEEFAVPYLIFKATDFDVTVASPKGGLSPIDEGSMSCSNPEAWDDCIKLLRHTEKLSDIDYKKYDAIFLPGGHGPIFDLAHDLLLKEILEYFYKEDKFISAVCHGPAGLILAKDDNGNSILNNKKITAFTNNEEKIVHKTELVPFSLEDKLKELGAIFEKSAPWSKNVCVDGKIITGQNPQSSTLLAEKVIDLLK